MSGAHGGRGRLAAIALGSVVALVLALVGEARAGKYDVVQCGWHVGADATWADTTGGVKFRPDSYCAPSPSVDPFDGVHLKSFTKGAGTVSGTRFARWRWEAPPGTAITRVSGTWWHALHDGFEQRIGAGNGGGGFDVFASASSTDPALRDFVAGFSPGRPAIEDRLLCARLESKFCSIDDQSWSAVRALTLTLEDPEGPLPGVSGEILSGGWKRGAQALLAGGSDAGSGIRFGETLIDGARVGLTEYACAKTLVSGQWRATQMRPCELGVAATHTIDTTRFSDRPHQISHCVTDFAGNTGCTGQLPLLIDNNPPAHPRSLQVSGGEGWHRSDHFDLVWENPDQGQASPIAAAGWRIQGGPGGIDTGASYAVANGVASLSNLTVPRAGAYAVSVWLRDEAGNEASSSAATSVLRLDDIAPGIAFAPDGEGDSPDAIEAVVNDDHSGPAGGEIDYRRLGSDNWTELLTKSQPGKSGSQATLVARVPESLAPGTYLFRAEAVDGAGNRASTTRRADGTEMTLRRDPPRQDRSPGGGREHRAGGESRGKTRLFAKLRWQRHLGTAVTVPFAATARLSGRLIDAGGAGIAGRDLRVVCRASKGALAPTRVLKAVSGKHGGFHLDLPPGPSRRISVAFRGDDRLDPALRSPLSLRVRGDLSLRARPTALDTGQTLALWGRVKTKGAPVPRRGKLVAIQYLEAASDRWRPVLVTRTDHSGHYRARYRFRYVSGAARIRLRAVAMAEERWPYVPGASKPVTVRVSASG